MSPTPSRRRLLQAALLAPAAVACTPSRERPLPPDPDDLLRSAAAARERALLAMYDATPPGLLGKTTAVRSEHEQHLALLLGPSVAGSPSPTASGPAAPPPTGAQLIAAERSAAAAHAAAALEASRDLAAVLASLAASEASHPIALA